jgi:YVTN family beta-propeller protein
MDRDFFEGNNVNKNSKLRSTILLIVIATAQLLTGIGVAESAETTAGDDQGTGDINTGPPSVMQSGTISRNGVNVDFTLTPVEGGTAAQPLKAGDLAEIAFRITSADSGEPLRSAYPGVWVDIAKAWQAKDRSPAQCEDRVSLYLQGLVGIRPQIDLNSYYVMVLNRDPSISVIDPVVGISGITSLYTTIQLERPGADWAKDELEQWMYVSMPAAGKIAVVDLDTFKVEMNISVGDKPTRVALQPDERYLWIGNNATDGSDGGVTVVDTVERKVVATIPTGAGHHEIAFSPDDRYAFVSNRDAGTVSIIDVQRLERVRDIDTGGVPLALAASPASGSVYVVDGESGTITVIDSRSLDLSTRIETKAGLGPLRFSEDGRWGVAVNPSANEAYVIDAASGRLAHTLPVPGKPYKVSMSPSFAYIRALDSERVSMINLTQLSREGELVVTNFAAGSTAPGKAMDISIADSIVPAVNEAAVLVVSPADATVYYYMEGMNAPMGAFRNYGHAPRAVEVANRALKETEPGLYTATVRVPASGTFDVAYLNESPRFMHCFSFEASPNPEVQNAYKPMDVDFLMEKRRVSAGNTKNLRFRITDPRTGQPRTDVEDATVLYYRAPNFGRTTVPARHVGDGIYEAELDFKQAGAYYVFVESRSEKMKYQDLDYLTLMAVRNEG